MRVQSRKLLSLREISRMYGVSYEDLVAEEINRGLPPEIIRNERDRGRDPDSMQQWALKKLQGCTKKDCPAAAMYRKRSWRRKSRKL